MVKKTVSIRLAVLAAFLLILNPASRAAQPEKNPGRELHLPAVIGSHMVLQRDKPLPIWGWAGVGEEVIVEIAGNQAKAKADDDGSWQVKLPEMTAGGPHKMTVSGKKKTITLENVMVGEVWLCSGQSNMKMALNNITNSKQECEAANYPSIRMLTVSSGYQPFPVRDYPAKGHGAAKMKWAPCSPQVACGFSAVGYFFGRELHRELKVPIGLIGSYENNSAIEWWTPAEGLQSVPELKAIWDRVAAWTLKSEAGKKAHAAYIASMKRWAASEETALGRGAYRLPPPTFRDFSSQPGYAAPMLFYNGKIHPLVPYAIRGVIWYQGERGHKEGDIYFHKMKALIQGWRRVWDQGDFPFYYVQLPNFTLPRKPASKEPAAGEGYTIQREVQKKALAIPNTGMAVTIDVGGPGHPRNKQDVGKRLALWPLAKVYGKKIVFSGPLYKGHKIEGGKVRISFDHMGSGLMAGSKKGIEHVKEVPGGKLAQFATAGADKKWHWAEAVIEGNDVVVSSSDVPVPVAVRYAWDSDPKGANLYNKEGLPASPFRTDTWEK